jgi:RNA polymerase sigma factor (sigma-70 family)
MSPEHARKLGKLFVGGSAAWEAFAHESDPRKRRHALNRIVRDNEPFIIKCVRSLTARGASPLSSVATPDFEDALQAGRLGYATAIERFDPELGALPSFAKSWIRNSVQRAISKDKTIHIPEQQKLPKAALDAADRVYAKHGHEATAKEIGGITQTQLDNWRTLPTVVSDEERCTLHSGDCRRVGELRKHEACSQDPDPEELTGLKELQYEVSILPDRERQTMEMLYWEGATIQQVALALRVHVDDAMDIRDSALQTLHDNIT